eukprot:1366631-Amphidinium_carterae.1
MCPSDVTQQRKRRENTEKSIGIGIKPPFQQAPLHKTLHVVVYFAAMSMSSLARLIRWASSRKKEQCMLLNLRSASSMPVGQEQVKTILMLPSTEDSKTQIFVSPLLYVTTMPTYKAATEMQKGESLSLHVSHYALGQPHILFTSLFH